MAKRTNSEYVKSLHKKLVPANIFICIIALIAGICMLLMPWFDMRIQLKGDKIADLIREKSSEAEASLESDGATYAGIRLVDAGSGDTPSVEVDYMDALAEALVGVNFNIPVNIYPMKMLKAATGTKKDVEAFANSLVGKEGAAVFVEELADKVVPAVAKTVVNVAIEEMINQAIMDVDGLLNLTDEQKEAIRGYKDDAMKIIDDLLKAESKDAAYAVWDADLLPLIDKIVDEGKFGDIEIDDDDLEDVEKAFDLIIDYGWDEESNSFNFMNLIENINKLMDKESSEDDDGQQPAAYTAMPTAEGTSEADEIQKIVDTLKNPGGALIDQLGDGDISLVQTVALVLFIVMVGIPAFFWFLLALCALLRCFREEKIVKTWYVKLLCIWSGLGVLLGNLIPIVLPKVLPRIAGAETAEAVTTVFSALSIKFLGSGIVAGVCWLALLFCGWFYYNRKKKQIKKARKQGL